MPGFNIPLAESCHDPEAFVASPAYFGPGYNVETARKHRYLLDILTPLGTAADGLLLFLKHCTRPSPEIDIITIHNAQDEIYRPGKNRWKEVELTFYETLKGQNIPGNSDIDDTAQRIFIWWSTKVLDLKKSKLQKDFTFDAQLSMLDGFGNSVWSYHMYRCWPTKVSPSDLSYTDTDIAEISINVRCDKIDEKSPDRKDVIDLPDPGPPIV